MVDLSVPAGNTSQGAEVLGLDDHAQPAPDRRAFPRGRPGHEPREVVPHHRVVETPGQLGQETHSS
jgi:hypothetical protein